MRVAMVIFRCAYPGGRLGASATSISFTSYHSGAYAIDSAGRGDKIIERVGVIAGSHCFRNVVSVFKDYMPAKLQFKPPALTFCIRSEKTPSGVLGESAKIR